ncbi:hypothetical protein LOD99_7347 [Oopsacas minuta]|uniref:Fucosyltransferase n=1 Tax=Oopsacas minuta TaxID=111878 RepID=A0AAV7JTL9_9METZ|nr:hypothetical protein LOD99_7347 [Oopsacas minuta]
MAHLVNCEIHCELTENQSNPDAEFITAMFNGHVLAAVEGNSQVPIRILASQEPQHYSHLLKLEYLSKHFEGSALLDRKSDIPWLLIPNMDVVKEVTMPKDALPKATFVARNCYPMNYRNEYVRVIGNKIGLIAPGECLNNMNWPDCNGRPCSKVEVLRGSKIHLAFENGDSPGYISEKVYQAFEAGVLPVWMGTRDITDAVPKGSYIDVAEFNSPDDVANYLKLVLENETLYNSYFEWKKKPFDPEYVKNNEVLWTDSIFCRTCYYVDTLKRGLEWDHAKQRAKSSDVINSDNKFSLYNIIPNTDSALIIINSILLLIIFRRKLLHTWAILCKRYTISFTTYFTR